MPATASLPITPVLGHLRDLIGDSESVSARRVVSLEVPATRRTRSTRRAIGHGVRVMVHTALAGLSTGAF